MRNTYPLISVVIPTYNRIESIEKSIKSVLSQSYPYLELIVVDDGSCDGTRELFNGLSQPRLRYFRYEDNRGACYARNYGAQRAIGEFIAFQDSDDIWHADKLEKQVAIMKKTGSDFVFCGMNRVSANGKSYYYPVSGFDNGGDALAQFLLENRAGTQTMLMRREVWEQTQFDESFKRYQDWDFALRVASRYSMAYVDEALVDSTVSVSSISSSVSAYPALCQLLEKHWEEFSSRPECLARFYRRMANNLAVTNPCDGARLYREELRQKMSMGGIVRYIDCLAHLLAAKIKGRWIE